MKKTKIKSFQGMYKIIKCEHCGKFNLVKGDIKTNCQTCGRGYRIYKQSVVSAFDNYEEAKKERTRLNFKLKGFCKGGIVEFAILLRTIQNFGGRWLSDSTVKLWHGVGLFPDREYYEFKYVTKKKEIIEFYNVTVDIRLGRVPGTTRNMKKPFARRLNPKLGKDLLYKSKKLKK